MRLDSTNMLVYRLLTVDAPITRNAYANELSKRDEDSEQKSQADKNESESTSHRMLTQDSLECHSDIPIGRSN